MIPKFCSFAALIFYLIRLRKRRFRCRRFEERVRQEIPCCGIHDLYESAGQKVTIEIQPGQAGAKRKLLQLRGRARLRTLLVLKRLNTTEFPRDARQRGCESLPAHMLQ